MGSDDDKFRAMPQQVRLKALSLSLRDGLREWESVIAKNAQGLPLDHPIHELLKQLRLAIDAVNVVVRP